MATIRSQMSLNDGMSVVLKKITTALDTTLNAFEQVQRASGRAVNVAQIEQARGQLVEANDEIQQMADNYRHAAEQEDKLNQSIRSGTSAADGLLKKITSMVAAYASIATIKNAVTDSLEAADVQLDAQVQLRTTLANSGSLDAYGALLDKASDIQGRGIYGDEAMIGAAAEFSTYLSSGDAVMSMMDTLSNYAMGMSGGGELSPEQIVDYATQLGKVLNGTFDGIAKKGFTVSEAQKKILETGTEMEKVAVVADIINESWDGLYEAMSQTPRGQLIQFNNTLGDIKETVGAGVYPAVLNFVQVFQKNLPQIQRAADGFAVAIGTILTLLTYIVEGAINVGTAISNNWSWIEPIVWGIVAAMVAYNAIQAILAATSTASALAEAVHGASVAFKTGMIDADTKATFANTAAQYGLNAALLACPITWIVVGVLALLVAIIAVCNWIAKTTGVAATGFGVITGGINVAVQAVWNAMLVVANVAIGIWNAMSACCSNIGTAFHNVIASVQGWFYNLLSTALTVVAGICEALNKLPFVEFDYSGIASKAQEYADKSAAAYDSREDYTSVADAFTEGYNTFDTFTEGWASDAFKAGAAWGDGVADKVGGLFSFESGSMDDLMGAGFDLSNIAGDTSDIANSAGGIADSLDVSNEQLEYLRDIAERDAINRFTTAEVKIDMTGMTNRIDGSADLDGVISQLTEGFTEALVTAAEGVHA